MNTHRDQHSDFSFVIGLFTGALVGAGVAMWLAPRATSELRERLTEAATDVSRRAAEQYQEISTGVGRAVDELARRGEGVRPGARQTATGRPTTTDPSSTGVRVDGPTEAREGLPPGIPKATPPSI
jgi:gas vesicle protein